VDRSLSQGKAVVTLAILLACCPGVSALDPSLDISQYAHTTWKVQEGFSKGAINAIAQTADGYLWLGTDFGLLRFDGVRTVAWEPRGNEHLPSSLIRTLLVSRNGNLWIGTHKGLASWKDGKLTQYPDVPGQSVDTLLEDREGTVWVGVETIPTWRLCAIQNGRVQCYGENGSLGLGVGTLFEDSKGNLWAGTGTGLWRWKPGAPKLIPLSGPASEIHALVEGDNGALLISTRAGIIQLVDGKAAPYPLPDTGPQFNPFWLLRDRNGGLWIGTKDRGLFHVHQGRTDHFGQSDGLSGDSIEDLFEDREGDVWVATDNGLDRFRDFAVSTISVKQGLSSASVESVLTAMDGSVWLGTRDGLDRWNDRRVTLYRKQRSQAPETVREITDSGLPDDLHSSLFQDRRGRIWAFSRGGASYFEGSHFIPLRGVPGGFAHSIAEDSAGDLWISQDQGLFHLRREGGVEQIPWSTLGPRGLALALVADPLQGGLWLGFSQGGVAYFKDGQVRALYGAAEGLGEGRVSALRFGSRGTLWAATEGGLSRIKDGKIATLTSTNGLPCDAVHWSMEDNDHAVWLYMACGLVRIARPELDAWLTNPKGTIQTTVFGNSDGVRLVALTGALSPHVGKSKDGKIWFVSGDGVSVLDPHHLPFNKIPPPVYIEQITANGNTHDAANGLRLPPRVRDLAIDYTALSLVAPEKVHFRFKLEGQDDDWREVVNKRRAEYSNLPPGGYRFRVKACNNSGVWNEEGATLDFSVAPAYYQTNWFRALCVLMFTAMLWTVYQLRVRALERHRAEIRALNDQLIKGQEAERMRIAGELHDGVLQQITSLTLKLGTAKYQVPPDSEAKATISGLQQDLIGIGTDVRHLSHELHPVLLQEAGLPAALSSYCEEFSKVRGLPVSCEADESVKELSPGAALGVYRIAQEALGNAAKYSEAKKVEVRLARSDGRVWLSVSDDGVGCDRSQVGTSGGLGLINMRERVHQLDGTFEFDSEPGRGTRVRVTIPFRPATS